MPIPTCPLAVITKGVESGEELSSTKKLGPEPLLVSESFAYGVELPIPKLPLKFAPAAVSMPESVGEALNTKFPLPVSSVTIADNSAEVSMSVEARLPAPQVCHSKVVPVVS